MIFKTRMHSWKNAVGVIAAGLLVVVFAISMGWLFMERGQLFLDQEQKLRLYSMATIAATGLDPALIAQIHVAEDYTKPAYIKLTQQLIAMRQANPDIRFAYIFRPTDNPSMFEFVADADSLDPYAVFDLNKDGIIDESDELAPPGEPYDISETPELTEALTAPSITREPYSDQWGTYMSGFAPIKNDAGVTVAVVGIDIDIARYINLSQRIFSPFLFLLLLLVAFIVAGYIIFFVWKRRSDAIRSLNQERAKLLRLSLHQLGTPLTIVRWANNNFSKIKESISDPAVVEVFDFNIKNLTEAGNRFENILQVLRKADQIQSGTLEYVSVPSDLAVMIRDSIEKIKFLVNERQQQVKIDVKSPFLCKFDVEQIPAVITELVTNASQFSPPKSVITIHAIAKPEYVEVTVEDQGAGISDEDKEHLFEKFTRGDNAQQKHPDGYGLGLHVTKGIIVAAGGKIWVENKPDRGTIIHFTLPQ